MQTIVELPEFQDKASKLLLEKERQGIINYLAAHPQAGVVMQGTGGIRKFRWATGNKGKSGGVRVIYYFHSASIPIFLLSVFGKKDKANLTNAERNELAKLTKLIIKHYGN
jgi:hypothetical protein